MAEPPVARVVTTEVYAALRRLTDARVGLGRAGQGLPTAPMLAFQLAHARAQDAVHREFDVSCVSAALVSVDDNPVIVDSAAADRAAYLQDPGLGRRLGPAATGLTRGEYDLAIVIGDGLSATAVHAHAATVVIALIALLPGWRIAPIVLARQARVALGDEIGERLGAAVAVMLIGERPGLSAADSLGAYITWQPHVGRRDSERNCVSNIRDPGGLAPALAAEKIAWLLREARKLGQTGVALKDGHQFTPALAPPDAGSDA